jgi:phosphate uptake regulator
LRYVTITLMYRSIPRVLDHAQTVVQNAFYATITIPQPPDRPLHTQVPLIRWSYALFPTICIVIEVVEILCERGKESEGES